MLLAQTMLRLYGKEMALRDAQENGYKIKEMREHHRVRDGSAIQ